MAFKLKDFFINDNVAGGLPAAALFQVGVNDEDDGELIERYMTLPWASDPDVSWIAYRNRIECLLDPGIVVHKSLPTYASQASSDAAIDTLASVDIDDDEIGSSTDGENLISNGGWSDYVQRMATSEYTFVLTGFGVRAGYTIPVPGITTIAGVPAIGGKQWSRGNEIIGNYSGVPLYYNAWRLEYTVSIPPKEQQPAPPNVAMHIGGKADLPDAMVAMYSQADANAQSGGGA